MQHTKVLSSTWRGEKRGNNITEGKHLKLSHKVGRKVLHLMSCYALNTITLKWKFLHKSFAVNYCWFLNDFICRSRPNVKGRQLLKCQRQANLLLIFNKFQIKIPQKYLFRIEFNSKIITFSFIFIHVYLKY